MQAGICYKTLKQQSQLKEEKTAAISKNLFFFF
jgi:hypothetical protein